MLTIAVFLGLSVLSQAYPQQSLSNGGSAASSRVAGGSSTTIEKFPYVVSVREDLQGGYDVHICGGSIISNYWVLTAGQCVMGDIPDMYAIRAGNEHVDKGTRHKLSQIVLYKQFQSGDVAVNDISLLKVEKEFVYSNSIKAVKLVEASKTWGAGTAATVAGWGPTLPEGVTVDVLRVATVSVVANSECTSAYKTHYHQQYMMCVDHKNVRQGACVNDEGSALVHDGVQIGVVSFTTACFNGTSNAGPGIYTSVSYFRNWIKSETGV